MFCKSFAKDYSHWVNCSLWSFLKIYTADKNLVAPNINSECLLTLFFGKMDIIRTTYCPIPMNSILLICLGVIHFVKDCYSRGTSSMGCGWWLWSYWQNGVWCFEAESLVACVGELLVMLMMVFRADGSSYCSAMLRVWWERRLCSCPIRWSLYWYLYFCDDQHPDSRKIGYRNVQWKGLS